MIVGGARIGPGSVVAAGSVVLAGEYPPNSFLAGVPAVVKKRLSPDNSPCVSAYLSAPMP